MVASTQGRGNDRHLFLAGESANLYDTMEVRWWFLRKLGIDLPQDPAYSEDSTPHHRDTCSSTVTAALVVIAEIENSPDVHQLMSG